MYYKLTHLETSHDDWIRLNLDHMHSDLIVKAAGEDAFEVIEWVNVPERENENDDFPELYGGIVPAQSYVYVFTDNNDDRPEMREALDSSGFVLFETQGDHPVEFFFGIDGGGYSFMGQHWIPLRAKLAAARLLDTTYKSEPNRLRECLTQWEADMQRQGEDLQKRCPEVYEALREAERAA